MAKQELCLRQLSRTLVHSDRVIGNWKFLSYMRMTNMVPAKGRDDYTAMGQTVQ